MRIALLADSHLSARAPECVQNWHAAQQAVLGLGVDFSVHLGDIALDAETAPEELDDAARHVGNFPGPLYCLPGNHDIGTGSGEEPLRNDLLARYRRLFGADRWCRRDGSWLLCGLNAQLFGTHTEQEDEQWRWFAQHTAQLQAHDSLALFLHRPLRRMAGDLGMPSGRYLPAPAAERLLNSPAGRHLRLVASGHVHQALDEELDGIRHVWVPSCAFVIGDGLQQRIGAKHVGLAVLALDGPMTRVDFVEPPQAAPHALENLGFYLQRQAAATAR